MRNTVNYSEKVVPLQVHPTQVPQTIWKRCSFLIAFILLSPAIYGQTSELQSSAPDTLDQYTDSKWTVTYYDNLYSTSQYSIKGDNVPFGYVRDVEDEPEFFLLNSGLELNYRWNEHFGVSSGFKYEYRQTNFIKDTTYLGGNGPFISTKQDYRYRFLYSVPLFLTYRQTLNKKFQLNMSLGIISSYQNDQGYTFIETDYIEDNTANSLNPFEMHAYFRPEIRVNMKHWFIGLYGAGSAQLFGAVDLKYIDSRRYAVSGGISVGHYLYSKKNTVFRPDIEEVRTPKPKPESFYRTKFSFGFYAGYGISANRLKAKGDPDTLMPHTYMEDLSIPTEINLNYQFGKSFGASVGFEYFSINSSYTSTHDHYETFEYQSQSGTTLTGSLYQKDANFIRHQSLKSYTIPIRVFFQQPIGKHFDANIGAGVKLTYNKWLFIWDQPFEVKFEPEYKTFSMGASLRPEIRWRFRRTSIGLFADAYYDLKARVTFSGIRHTRFGINPGISLAFHLGKLLN